METKTTLEMLREILNRKPLRFVGQACGVSESTVSRWRDDTYSIAEKQKKKIAYLYQEVIADDQRLRMFEALLSESDEVEVLIGEDRFVLTAADCFLMVGGYQVKFDEIKKDDNTLIFMNNGRVVGKKTQKS